MSEPLDDFSEFLSHAMNAVDGALPEAERVVLDAAAALVPKPTPMRNGNPRV